MSPSGRRKRRTPRHPYLSGNFAPVTKTWTPTPVACTGTLPPELLGGMYVRNGGNPVTNEDLGREAHWFDGDGMLSGVWFERSSTDPTNIIPKFVNQFIFTDVYLSSIENPSLRTPILPSIATLVNPVSALFHIIWRILRTVMLVILSHCAGSNFAIKRISVANTGILYHDGRALATCESGPPIRVTLPELETVGWFNGKTAEGEPAPGNNSRDDHQDRKEMEPFGGSGPLSWMKEWTTGHPKVDQETGELVLFHCTFAPPYVHYSLVPPVSRAVDNTQQSAIMNAPVPGCSGGKLMHDFGVSKHHTIILDLPLSLTPLNLAKNEPVVSYQPKKPSRFGVFPRRDPRAVRWFETRGCCIFHTANTWDEFNYKGEVVAVSLLACRLTSASLIFSAGNIVPPAHPDHNVAQESRPMSFFSKYEDDEQFGDPEKLAVEESSPLLIQDHTPAVYGTVEGVPISYDEHEQCRLYYYRFALDQPGNNEITEQYALSAIPFEFPTVSPVTDMVRAQYIYGCSTSIESFGAALGKATKVDVIVRMDVKSLLSQAQQVRPEAVVGCVDERDMNQILASNDPKDPIRAFKLPRNHYAQEPRFVPRGNGSQAEDDGYLLFYVFNEDQLDAAGECTADATSELWVLDASNMRDVVCKVHLPARIPYGLHGNWFSEEQIADQRDVDTLRRLPETKQDTRWSGLKQRLVHWLN